MGRHPGGAAAVAGSRTCRRAVPMRDHIAGLVLLTRDGDGHTSSWLTSGRTRDAIARYRAGARGGCRGRRCARSPRNCSPPSRHTKQRRRTAASRYYRARAAASPSGGLRPCRRPSVESQATSSRVVVGRLRRCGVMVKNRLSPRAEHAWDAANERQRDRALLRDPGHRTAGSADHGRVRRWWSL